jgi:hypothetical protein
MYTDKTTFFDLLIVELKKVKVVYTSVNRIPFMSKFIVLKPICIPSFTPVDRWFGIRFTDVYR